MSKLLKWMLSLSLIALLAGCRSKENSDEIAIYQLPNQSYSQMMSYIIESNGTTIVIDGGTIDDEDYLVEKIKEISGDNIVEGWFLTHYHKDHTGALAQYLESDKADIEIKKIFYNFPEETWVSEYEPNRLLDIKQIDAQLYKIKENVVVELNMNINLGDVVVDVLRTYNPEIIQNAGNNSSSVYKFVVNEKEILFLGDLGVEGGVELMELNGEAIKNMDYVQMAHHGQAGVSENVYSLINPSYCLWPTTDWLWKNEDGAYQTDETKSWINKLNVKENYVAKDGLIRIDLK